MEFELSFHIVLEKPTVGVDFGMQKGKGNDYLTVQTQRSAGSDLHFDFTARVKTGKDDQPDFYGPFVQGPAGQRFVYIDIGTYAGQSGSEWGRRLKIPLSGITAAMAKKLETDPSLLLMTAVPGTGKDGGPNCATVKPFAGWKPGSKNS